MSLIERLAAIGKQTVSSVVRGLRHGAWSSTLALVTLGCAAGDADGETAEEVSRATGSGGVRCIEGPAGVYTSESEIVLGGAFGDGALPSEQLRGIRVIRADVFLAPDAKTIASLSCVRRVEGNFNVWEGPSDTDLPWTMRGFENLKEVTGDFNVGGELAGLSGLRGLVRVGGSFGLSLSKARDLQGLDNLKSVGDRLLLSVGTLFESFRGATRLEEVPGELQVDCRGLTPCGPPDMRGFEKLRVLGGLHLTGLSHLTSLRGLPPVRRFNRSVLLYELDGLTSLAGLESLETVDEAVQIWELTALSNLNGLSGLRHVGSLNLARLAQVTELQAFSRLKTAGALAVEEMSALRSLPKFTELSAIDSIMVVNNPLLTSLRGLERVKSVPRELLITSHTTPLSLTGLEGLVSVGQFQITGSGVTSLAPLRNLTSAQQLVFILSGLRSLQGLERLTSLGSLEVQSNAHLESLQGLSGVTAISGGIRVNQNPVLPSLSGLSTVTQAGALWLSDLPKLVDLTGLERLQRLSDELHLFDLPALTSFKGLESLTRVEGDVELRNLTALTSCTGLDALAHIEGRLRLESLPLLENPLGLGSLVSTNGLEIYGNQNLVSLSGLAALTSVGSGQLSIRSNPKLPVCEAEALASQVATRCGCPDGSVPTCGTSPFDLPCDSFQYCKCEGTCQCSGNDNAQVCTP